MRLLHTRVRGRDQGFPRSASQSDARSDQARVGWKLLPLWDRRGNPRRRDAGGREERGMSMADETNKYTWPAAEQRTLIGKRVSRVDGPDKVAGRAKYTYDMHRPGMLYAKVVRCPYPHAKVVSVDSSAAEKMPGVAAVHVVQGPGSEVHWAGDDIVVVAAVDEGAAADAASAIKVEYEQLPFFLDDFTHPENVSVDTGPLGLDDVVGMFRNQVPEPQIIDRVHKPGITFKVTTDMSKQMRQNHVGEAVISALQAAPMQPPTDSAKMHYRKNDERIQGGPASAFNGG